MIMSFSDASNMFFQTEVSDDWNRLCLSIDRTGKEGYQSDMNPEELVECGICNHCGSMAVYEERTKYKDYETKIADYHDELLKYHKDMEIELALSTAEILRQMEIEEWRQKIGNSFTNFEDWRKAGGNSFSTSGLDISCMQPVTDKERSFFDSGADIRILDKILEEMEVPNKNYYSNKYWELPTHFTEKRRAPGAARVETPITTHVAPSPSKADVDAAYARMEKIYQEIAELNKEAEPYRLQKESWMQQMREQEKIKHDKRKAKKLTKQTNQKRRQQNNSKSNRINMNEFPAL
jgi:hypothetical protein